MPEDRVFFCVYVAFSLLSLYVNQYCPIPVLDVVKGLNKLFQVMSFDRTYVLKAEAFKQDTGGYKALERNLGTLGNLVEGVSKPF